MTVHPTPQPVSSIGALADLVRARPPRLGTTRLVLIDGPAGSGKTTLANALAVALGGSPSAGSGTPPADRAPGVDSPLQILHADDMYEGWTGLDTLDEVLIDQVLAPLIRGQSGSFGMWDWHRGARTELIEVRARPLLIVEGVGVAMRPAREYASATVWIEAEPRERLRRGLARDGDEMREEWVAWQAREEAEFARQGTRQSADVVVDGNVPLTV